MSHTYTTCATTNTNNVDYRSSACLLAFAMSVCSLIWRCPISPIDCRLALHSRHQSCDTYLPWKRICLSLHPISPEPLAPSIPASSTLLIPCGNAIMTCHYEGGAVISWYRRV